MNPAMIPNDTKCYVVGYGEMTVGELRPEPTEPIVDELALRYPRIYELEWRVTRNLSPLPVPCGRRSDGPG